MFHTKRAYWRKLDNAAKIFPATSNREDPRVFRFYCELKEKIEENILQEALDRTIKKYPLFLSVMRKGFFWYYLEKSDLKPLVSKEKKSPCTSLYSRDQKSLLFEVTYYENRINFEVFHALTDGTGAVQFLKELVKNYLIKAYKEEKLQDIPLLDETITMQDQESDSFAKYYQKKKGKVQKKKVKSFQLSGVKTEHRTLQVTEGVVSTSAILKKAKEYQASITVFLTAVFICAIHEEMTQWQQRKPVVLMVPVNLRKYFPSNSMLNFFGWINPGYQFGQDKNSLSDVIAQVKEYFKKELTKEQVGYRMSQLAGLEHNPILRLVPLTVKNFCLQLGAKLSKKNVTAIFSNIGAVSMPEEYSKYILRFGVFTTTPKIELCMCSFEEQLVLSFASCFQNLNIQRNFFRILQENELKVELIEPKFPKQEKKEYVGMRFFQWFSFLCIVISVLSIMANVILTPNQYWSAFVSGAILSMWSALAIGFYKRYNLLKNAMWQMVFISFGCILWDLLTGWHGWSLDYILPAAIFLTMVSILIITKVQKLSASEYMIYYIMNCGFGLIPFVLLLFGVIQINYPSILCVGFSFLFFMGLLIFKKREFMAELYKRLHF